MASNSNNICCINNNQQLWLLLHFKQHFHLKFLQCSIDWTKCTNCTILKRKIKAETKWDKNTQPQKQTKWCTHTHSYSWTHKKEWNAHGNAYHFEKVHQYTPYRDHIDCTIPHSVYVVFIKRFFFCTLHLPLNRWQITHLIYCIWYERCALVWTVLFICFFFSFF